VYLFHIKGNMLQSGLLSANNAEIACKL